MNQKILNKSLHIFSYLAIPLLQKLWYKLYMLGLAGMGYGYSFNEQMHAKQYVYQKLGYNLPNSKEFVFFDIGANFGQTIEKIQEIAADNCNIYAFEPQKTCLNTLYKDFSSKNTHIYGFGFGKENGSFNLYKSIEGSGTASIFESENNISTLSEKIEIKKIDDFAKENNIEYISYLKIDVEGGEYSVLLGAKDMLDNKKIEAIEFEFFKQNLISKVSFKDFWDLLSNNFDFYRILPRHIYEIKSYHHLLEIYAVSNILCIKKEEI